MRQQDFKMVQGVNQIVQMNPSTGIQAGNALSRLGEQIASTGQDVSKIMETTAQAEEETKLLRMEQDWDAAFQKQQEFQRDNPNEPPSPIPSAQIWTPISASPTRHTEIAPSSPFGARAISVRWAQGHA